MYKKLEPALKEEVKEKINSLQDKKNHTVLKVHRLNGRLEGRYAFSVNYKIRIVFRFENRNTISLLYVGSHDVYK